MNKKNVLVIMADQLRKDSLGCYGNNKTITPNIDRIANMGVRFDRCYCANPICMPNRVSIFTGMYPSNHGVWTNGVKVNERRTIATELSHNGYQTASFGKLHFSPTGDMEDGAESKQYWKRVKDNFSWDGPYWGFQHVEFTIGHTLPIAHYGKWFREKGGEEEQLTIIPIGNTEDSGITSISKDLHDSTFIGERTSDFIRDERDKEKPFFVVASFPDPHAPFNPPQECTSSYDFEDAIIPVGDKKDLESRPAHYRDHFKGEWHRKGRVEANHPDGLPENSMKERIVHTYAMVNLIDENIGKIIKSLEDENILEDTIIIFTSDHGELLGDHGLWLKGPFYYEGLMNIPLIIADSSIKGEKVSKELVSSIDISSTIFDLLGLEETYYADGLSIKPNLLDTSKKVRNQCMIQYRNGFKDCASRAIVTDQYKYVLYQNGKYELTDLINDPQETTNIAKENKDIVDKMNCLLLEEILNSETKLNKQISFS